jgi:hypothetical protein
LTKRALCAERVFQLAKADDVVTGRVVRIQHRVDVEFTACVASRSWLENRRLFELERALELRQSAHGGAVGLERIEREARREVERQLPQTSQKIPAFPACADREAAAVGVLFDGRTNVNRVSSALTHHDSNRHRVFRGVVENWRHLDVREHAEGEHALARAIQDSP